MSQPELVVPFGFAVDEGLEPEALNEALQLTGGDWALLEVDEVRANAAFREEPNRLSRVRAFLHTKDLNFHDHLG